MSAAAAQSILVVCHKPPPYHDTLTSSRAQLQTLSFLNTNTRDMATPLPPRFFASWADVPDASVDVIWSQFCPFLGPFIMDEQNENLMIGDLLVEPGSSAIEFWEDALSHAHRILKPTGKFILPFMSSFGMHHHTRSTVLLTFRVINNELKPDYIYPAIWTTDRTKLPAFLLAETYDATLDDHLKPLDEWGFLVVSRREVRAELMGTTNHAGGGRRRHRTRRRNRKQSRSVWPSVHH